MSPHLMIALGFTAFVVLGAAAVCLELDAKRTKDSLNDEAFGDLPNLDGFGFHNGGDF
jgi:hypothetical protein